MGVLGRLRGSRGRACSTCHKPLAPGQDWCLECGAGASTRARGGGVWRVPSAILLAVAGLVVGGSAIAYASLSSDADKHAAQLAAAKPAAPTPGTPASGSAGPTTILPPATDDSAKTGAGTTPTVGGAPTPGGFPTTTSVPSAGSFPTDTGTSTFSPAPVSPSPTSTSEPAKPVYVVSHRLTSVARWSVAGTQTAKLRFGFGEKHPTPNRAPRPVLSIRLVIPPTDDGRPRQILSYSASKKLPDCHTARTNFPSDTLVCTGKLALYRNTKLSVELDPAPAAGMGADLVADRQGHKARSFNVSGPAHNPQLAPAPPPQLSALAGWTATSGSSNATLAVGFNPDHPGSGNGYESITELRVVLPETADGKQRQVLKFKAPAALPTCHIAATHIPDDTLVCTGGKLKLGRSARLEVTMDPRPTGGMGGEVFARQNGRDLGPFPVTGP